jgi:hypothetical protein
MKNFDAYGFIYETLGLRGLALMTSDIRRKTQLKHVIHAQGELIALPLASIP